jgi:hypothetical protein
MFAHPQERQAVFYSMWYNVTKLLPAGSLESGGIIPHAVKHSLALLRMRKNCPKHVELIGIINKAVIVASSWLSA